MLQAVAREHRTVNYTARFGGLRNRRAMQKMLKLQHMTMRAGSCITKEGVT